LKVGGTIYRLDRDVVLLNDLAGALPTTLGVAGGLAVAYFLAARLGLALRPEPVHMAVFWPASGVAAGLLIAAGRRAALPVGIGVIAGSIAAIMLNQRSFLDSTLLGVCNFGEVALLAWLLSWCMDGPFAFRDVRAVVAFLAAAFLAAAISGLGGAALLASSARPFPWAWLTWVPSHVVGVVVVAPLLLALDQVRRYPPSRSETLEALVPLTILVSASLYAWCQPANSWLTFSATVVTLPPLLWLAARCQSAFAIAGASISSSVVIGATTFGMGRFGDGAVQIMDRVHGGQAIVITLMASTLVLTALFEGLKRSNELLRVKEAGFRQLLDALPAAIQTTDTAGRITYCNQAAVELWGARPRLGRDTRHSLYRLYYPDGAPMPDDVQPCQVSLMERRKVRGQGAILERADGKRIPIIPCPSPLFDAAGKFAGIVNMHVDISDRKRVEEALAEREAQLALFVEHAPAAIAMFDREMRYLAVSRRFVIDFRLPPDASLIGHSHYEVFPEIPQRWRDIHARVLAGEELSQEEDQFTRQDGCTEWVRWSMAPWRRDDGQIGGAVLFSEVRTEQVKARRALAESEARFRATFENAAVGAALVGADGSLLRVNDCLARSLGYSAEELERKTFQVITHPDDVEANLSVLKKTLTGEGNSYCIEKRYVRKDGGIIWANLTVGCVRKIDGAVDYFISIIEDITDRKQTEARLAERNAQLELAGKVARIGSFAYDHATAKLQLSPGCAAVYGLPETTLEISREDWRARVHPDDLPRLDAVTRQALANRETDLVLEFRILRHGEVHWTESRLLISYDEAGQAVRRIGAQIDVTERKQAEQALAERNAQFDLAHKAARVGCYTYDISAKNLRLSHGSMSTEAPSQCTMEITADQWCARVHRGDFQHLRSEHIRAFKERQPEMVNEFRFVRLGGEIRWLEARSLIDYDRAGRAERLTGVYIDITERRKNEDHKSLLIAELDHRVKNVLACVAAVAQRSRECSRSADEFLDVLNGRINSLAKTHALLSRSHWQGVGLNELVHGELAFCANDVRLVVEGPQVELAAEATQPIAMVLHELATNASKYGALSNSDGRVLVRWRRQPNGGSGGNLVLEWRETGGPQVAPPSETGYGTSVIRDLIPYELGGVVDFVLATEGARCRLEIPATWLNNLTQASR
jgi:PAS domain S-box-containing protein